jgi:hypothetical protein
MRRRLTILALCAGVAGSLAGCATTTTDAGNGGSGGDQECIVLALGGNKLCGADAASWCRATDDIGDRSSAQPGDDLYDAKMTCQDLESQY